MFMHDYWTDIDFSLYGHGSVTGSNRCHNPHNAILTKYNIRHICLLACCNRNPYEVFFAEAAFAVLAVPSYLLKVLEF